jgi:hypothetical protein
VQARAREREREMAPAMAKVFAVLCVALLVARVDGARMLNSVDTGTMTAGTAPLDQTTTTAPPADDFSEFEAAPAPVDEYNYNNADDNNTTTTTTPEFSVEGFLVTSPPTVTDLTNSAVFTTEDSTLPQDESADPAEFAEQEPAEGGFLVPGSSVPISQEYPGGKLSDPQGFDPQGSSYVFDATTDDAGSVYPTPTQEVSYSDFPEELEFSEAPPIPQEASDETLQWEQPGN